MIYGNPKIRIEDDVTDRVGIRTLVLSQIWEASASAEVIGLDDVMAQRPAPPVVPGGLLYIGEQTRPEAGCLKTTWTFEGINGDGKSVTFRTRDNSLDYGFQGGFAEVDLRLHPKLDEFQSRYGGYPDPEAGLVFPPTLSKKPGGSGLNFNKEKNSARGETNPMFGHTSFLRMEGSYYYRYCSLSKPSFSRIGHIHSVGNIPGDAPAFSGRDYLMSSPQCQKRGLIWEVVETYWLSGVGGWPRPIYGGGLSES